MCQSQAVTLQYSLNATVAVEDASTHDMALKQVAMIDPDAMELRFAGDGLSRQSVVPATSMASTEACCCQTLQMQPCPACVRASSAAAVGIQLLLLLYKMTR